MFKLNYHSLLYGIATLGGIGTLVPAPGTFGSLLGLLFGMMIKETFSSEMLYLIIGFLFVVGCISSRYCENRIFFRKDAQEIIIDEFLGMFIVCLCIPTVFFEQILGLFVFRILDIYKPLPISLVEKIEWGGVGIMLDDFFASIISVVLVMIFCLTFR